MVLSWSGTDELCWQIFGSDSESEEQDSNNHKSKKLGPLQGQGLGQAALSPLHR